MREQATEKLLKAFLISRGRDVIRTHDLVALLMECVDLDPSLASLEGDCRNLTYFAVSARYPDDVYEPDEQDGREMIAAMHRVRSQILIGIPKKEQS